MSVLTSDVPSAGTSSKVYITLYGDHGSSGPIFLDGEKGKLFQRGNEDIFTVSNIYSLCCPLARSHDIANSL